ncbi:MAG TPA: hypothetical protein VFQ88_15260 [Nevskiaceae bacterium]|nr:hypothetical protein [Nevskiaceae bacterium]
MTLFTQDGLRKATAALADTLRKQSIVVAGAVVAGHFATIPDHLLFQGCLAWFGIHLAAFVVTWMSG